MLEQNDSDNLRKSDAIFDRLFLVLILMHLVINFRCGREPENAEKTRDVW